MQKHVKMLYRKRQEMRSECILILLCNFVLTFSYRYIHTYLFSNYCFIQKAHNNHSKSLLLLGRCIFFLFIFFRKKYPILSKYVSRVTVWISTNQSRRRVARSWIINMVLLLAWYISSKPCSSSSTYRERWMTL